MEELHQPQPGARSEQPHTSLAIEHTPAELTFSDTDESAVATTSENNISDEVTTVCQKVSCLKK